MHPPFPLLPTKPWNGFAKNSEYLYVLEISDVHLGHPGTPTEHILASLRTYIRDDAYMAALDMIIIAGDLFDRLLRLNQVEVSLIDGWMIELLRLCKKHHVKLRLLEGTPLHECKQIQRFIPLNINTRINADVKYFEKIDIEYDADLGLHILYVPDNANTTCEITRQEVIKLLETRGLSHVDIGVMHGMTDFQVPQGIQIDHHDTSWYETIVRYVTYFGHDHSFRVHSRTIVAGSFERLVHRDEILKGFTRTKIYPDGRFDVEFVVNECAKQYVTLRITDMDLNTSLTYIGDRVRDLPDGSYVRLEYGLNHPLTDSLGLLVTSFAHVVFSKPLIQTDKLDTKDMFIMADEALYRPVQITVDNIETLLEQRLIGRDCPSEEITALMDLFKEVL